MKNSFAEIVDRLIEFNKENRPKHMEGHISPVSYLKEFCVVSVGAGRSIGKTMYIANKARSNDLIVARDSRILRDTYRVPMSVDVEVIHENFVPRKSNYEIIYVDEPRLCFKHLRFDDFLCAVANSQIEQTIVCLGEW